MSRQKFKIILTLFFSLNLISCQPSHLQTDKILVHANIALAINYLQHHQPTLAKHYLITAKNLSPQDPIVWSSLGYYEEITGNPHQAKQDYQYATIIAPQSGEAHNNYGVFLCHQKNYPAAQKQFQLALQAPNYKNRERIYKNKLLCRDK